MKIDLTKKVEANNITQIKQLRIAEYNMQYTHMHQSILR
jgi:hypothetical protein